MEFPLDEIEKTPNVMLIEAEMRERTRLKRNVASMGAFALLLFILQLFGYMGAVEPIYSVGLAVMIAIIFLWVLPFCCEERSHYYVKGKTMLISALKWLKVYRFLVAVALVVTVLAETFFLHNDIVTMAILTLLWGVVAIPFRLNDRIYHDGSIKKPTKLEIIMNYIFSAVFGVATAVSAYLTYLLIVRT